jgi:hypothetical protein
MGRSLIRGGRQMTKFTVNARFNVVTPFIEIEAEDEIDAEFLATHDYKDKLNELKDELGIDAQFVQFDVSPARAEVDGWIESPDSSNVSKFKWEEPNLIVEFKGVSKYRYLDVPVELFEKMRVVESVGTFVHRNIKGKFVSEKIEE